MYINEKESLDNVSCDSFYEVNIIGQLGTETCKNGSKARIFKTLS